MRDTRERIMLTALQLFARDGYEAVPVSSIAGELGITKGALYRHFRDKRDIFESILRRMEQNDAESAGAHELPGDSAEAQPEAYAAASLPEIIAFSRDMFRYWTEDEFASAFRRMLTLEQYRSAEMARLYAQYLSAGPLEYVRELMRALGFADPEGAALSLCGPMFLLYAVYDAAEDKSAVTASLDAHLDKVLEELQAERSRYELSEK